MEGLPPMSEPMEQRTHRLHWWKEALIIAAFYVIIMTSMLRCTTAAKKALAKPVYGGPSVPPSAPAPVPATQLFLWQ